MAQFMDGHQHVLHHVFCKFIIEDTAADPRAQNRYQCAQDQPVGMLVAILRAAHQTGPCILKGQRIGHVGATIPLATRVCPVIRQTFLPEAASMAVITVTVSSTCGSITGSPPLAG